MADGETIKLTQVGSVVLTVLARGQQQDVTLTDVYLAPELSRNIMSYGKLEIKGFGLVYEASRACWHDAAMAKSRSMRR